MSMWQVMCLFLLLVIFQANGNPIPDKVEKNQVIRKAYEMKLKISKRDYLCNYYSNPIYDEYAFLNIPSLAGYLINVRGLRQRCNEGRYFEEPAQKYSVWDLTRK